MANTYQFVTVTNGSSKFRINSGPWHIIEDADWLDQLGGTRIRMTGHNGAPDIDTAVDTVIAGGTTYSPGSNVDTVFDALNPFFRKANTVTGGTGTVSGISDVPGLSSALSAKTDNLTPTAIKTAAYTAAANELVKTDATSATVPITLPTGQPDKTRIAVKMVAVSGTNTTTIATGGTDVFNKSGGATSATLSILNQAVTFQYESTAGIWSALSSDVPLSQLDLRFAKKVTGTATLGALSARVAQYILAGLTTDNSAFSLALVDSNNRAIAVFDNSGRVDIADYSGAGGILVLHNNAAAVTDQTVGHFAYYGKNSAGTTNCVATILARSSVITANAFSSVLQLGYCDALDQSANTFAGQFQPNKIVYIGSSGFILPGISILGANDINAAGNINFSALTANRVLGTAANKNLTTLTTLRASNDFSTTAIVTIGTVSGSTNDAAVNLYRFSGTANLWYGMRMIATGPNAGAIQFASGAAAEGSQSYNSVAIAFSGGAILTEKRNRTVVADAAYSLSATSSNFIAYTSLTATRAVTIGAASSFTDQHFVIQDEAGTAGTNNITIAGTINVAGVSTVNPVAINTNGGTFRFYSNGTSWFREF